MWYHLTDTLCRRFYPTNRKRHIDGGYVITGHLGDRVPMHVRPLELAYERGRGILGYPTTAEILSILEQYNEAI